MDPSLASAHPSVEQLRRFVHGSLASREMEKVADHLLLCDVCCHAALAVPDDRLVGLLRRGPVLTAERCRTGSCPP